MVRRLQGGPAAAHACWAAVMHGPYSAAPMHACASCPTAAPLACPRCSCALGGAGALPVLPPDLDFPDSSWAVRALLWCWLSLAGWLVAGLAGWQAHAGEAVQRRPARRACTRAFPAKRPPPLPSPQQAQVGDIADLTPGASVAAYPSVAFGVSLLGFQGLAFSELNRTALMLALFNAVPGAARLCG